MSDPSSTPKSDTPANDPSITPTAAKTGQEREELGSLTLFPKSIEARFEERLSPEQKQLVPQMLQVLGESIEEQTLSIDHPDHPSPELISAYEAISPGLGARVIEQSLLKERHAMDCQTEELAQERERIRQDGRLISYADRGQMFGFALFVLVLLFAAFAFYRGNEAFAGSLLAISVLGLIGSFVRSRATVGRNENNLNKPETD